MAIARRCLALFLLLFFSIAAANETPTGAPSPESWITVTLDNDVISGQDRHYTSGFQIAVPMAREHLPAAIGAWSADRDIGIAIGQRIYTPSNITRISPDPADRPYAGWLYLLGDMRIHNGREGDHTDRLLASIGVVGPWSLAHGTQNVIHRVLNQVPPKGWNAQLKNEAALLLGFERSWPALWHGDAGGAQWDFSPRANVTVGNVMTYAAAGAVARIGKNMPDDLAGTHVSLSPAVDSFHSTLRIPGWQAWLGVEARAVARNIFLDGNTVRDSASVARENAGYDLQAGYAMTWRTWRASLAFVRRSKEFKGQPNMDMFGQLNVSLAY